MSNEVAVNEKMASSSSLSSDPVASKETTTSKADDESVVSPSSVKQNPAKLSYVIEEYTPPALHSSHDLKASFSWNNKSTAHGHSNHSQSGSSNNNNLHNSSNSNLNAIVAADVSFFKHAPLSDCWGVLSVGMKVEVENRESHDNANVFEKSFWVASVLRINGYNARMRFEGFGQDCSKDFDISLCSDKIHPVGWCATKGKPLIPPKAIQNRQSDWKSFLVTQLTGACTIPRNFYAKIEQSTQSLFRPGMRLEVVDKMRISQMRVATIASVVGRRLHLIYDDVDHDDNGFWCHEESPLIHHVGWAKRVGHQIAASNQYFERCSMENFDENDCMPDMFPEYRQPPGNFVAGMKIEAVDPLNLANICVATVMKVLRFGFLMIRIDGYEPDESGSDWFCYHASSSLIFPAGFCEKNNMQLRPIVNWEERFTWYDYLKETKAIAAPPGLFPQRIDIDHGFKVGMKLEAADQMDPRLICVSTISRVVGRMLRVHFDGWEDEYDQWMDCESVDIYPVGWSELVGHKLEAPRPTQPQRTSKKKTLGRKAKKRASSSNNASHNNAASTNNNNSGRKSKRLSSPSSLSPATPSSGATTNEERETPPLPLLEVDNHDNGSKRTEISTPTSANTTTSTDNTATSPSLKTIPRLVDSAGQASSHLQRCRDVNLDPNSWSVEDMTHFLQINECNTLVENFTEQVDYHLGVDGKRFLSLEKSDIMQLVNNKIGPCLKVENLLQLLKTRMNPAQARFLSTVRKSS